MAEHNWKSSNTLPQQDTPGEQLKQKDNSPDKSLWQMWAHFVWMVELVNLFRKVIFDL